MAACVPGREAADAHDPAESNRYRRPGAATL